MQPLQRNATKALTPGPSPAKPAEGSKNGGAMRLDFAGERVLAVVAHPDDAELLCAGTLARARADGVAVGVCVLCRGDKGQPAEPVADLAAVRRREMTAAAEVLGAELFRGDFADGELADGPKSRRKLI